MCRLLRPFAKEIALFERNNASLIAQPGESLVSQLKHSALSRTFQFPIVRISRGLNEMYADKYIYIRTRCKQVYRILNSLPFAMHRGWRVSQNLSIRRIDR